ncbi:hypothetical protein BJX66DRAFT_305064 [Aspergillus keveii]|uniref:Rhodopsin domain-containing protein n=1 Tax=Aspergillus keveii TaxID=714993 RepID=A0ABR4G4J2_9EURO
MSVSSLVTDSWTTWAMRLPPDIRAPLTADNDDDHSGLVVVITSFYIVLTLSSLAGRLFSSHRKQVVQRDDYVFAALVILAFAQASVVLAQVHYGWGRRIDLIPSGSLDRMFKTGYAADILSIATLALSKIVTCIFYESLFYQMQRRFIRTILIVTIIWTITSIFLLAIRCDARPWTDISSEQCGLLFRRWQAITALDVVTEVSLLVYSAMAMAKVKVSLRQKLLVVLALGCRIVLVPLSALRLHYTNLQLRSSSPTLLGAYATTATEIYLSLSIICQITSSLKFIIAVYEDKDGVSYTDGSRQSHSGLGYKSKSGLSTDLSSQSHSQSHNARAYTTRRASRPMDIDGEGLDDLEALAGTSGTGSGSQGGALKIFRTMQFKVQDEAIELDDRGKEVEKTEAGVRGLE